MEETAEKPALNFGLQEKQGIAFNCPATEILYGGAAGGGKALRLDTPIATPSGWKTMGELQVGDTVFGADGKPCRVLAASKPHTRPCYSIVFDDGAEIIAADNHRWVTFTAKDLAALSRRTESHREKRRISRAKRTASQSSKTETFRISIAERNRKYPTPKKSPPSGSIRTTREIVDTLTTKCGRANHAVRCATPLNTSTAHLPISPYTLGLWLGDGTSDQGALTMAEADMEAIGAHIKNDGYTPKKRKASCAWGLLGLQKDLRETGMIRNKHIPPMYLRASEPQRVALIAGLMDSDGHRKASGGCEFTTTSKRLADGMVELINSIGVKVRSRLGVAKLNGVEVGKKWRLTFTPNQEVFRLPRKQEGEKTNRRTTRFRYIKKCEQLGDQEVKCIQVDSPDNLFLAGEAMIPTHNSHLMRVSAIYWATKIPGLQIGLFRRAYPDLITNHLEGPTSFYELLGPWIRAGLARVAMTRARIYFWNGSVIRLCYMNKAKDLMKFQGAEFHYLLFDELTHFHSNEYDFLRGRLRMTGLTIPEESKHLFPRILSGTNPGGIGHLWVKRRWVDKGELKLHRASKEEGGMLQCYIPAKLDDNPILKESDPDYENRLEGLGDPVLVKALRDGIWNIVAGAMFGDVWRYEKHTCEPFAIPPDWNIWRGGDDGTAAPSSITWLTQDPVTKTYYAIDNIHRAKMEAEDLAELTLEHDHLIPRAMPDGDSRPHGKNMKGTYDSSAFAGKGESPTTRGSQMNAMGTGWEPVEKWPGSRAARAQNLHRLLAPNKKDPQGRPGIIFFRTKCDILIETIPVLPRDPKAPEAVDSDSEDHAYDGLTYGLQHRVSRRGKMKIRGL